MHAAEGEKAVLELVTSRGFVALGDLGRETSLAPTTLRRDLGRMAIDGATARVHCGVTLIEKDAPPLGLMGVPLHENIRKHHVQRKPPARPRGECGLEVTIPGCRRVPQAGKINGAIECNLSLATSRHIAQLAEEEHPRQI